MIVILAVWLLAWLLVRRLYHGRLRRAPPWACGFPWPNARMQDTAEGFGQPIRQIFEPFFRMQRELPSPFDAQPRYRVTVEDHFWYWLYLPVVSRRGPPCRAAGGACCSRGRIAVYLLFSFLTLIAMLLVVTDDCLPAASLRSSSRSWRRCCSRRCSPAGSTSGAPGWHNPLGTQPDAALPPAAQAVQQGVGGGLEHASQVFRSAPYVVFSCMLLRLPRSSRPCPPTCRCHLRPMRLPWSGVFALARVFISLAAMDIGTAFGTLGARREMLIGFLAEPALLMVLFSALADLAVDLADDHGRDAGAPGLGHLSRLAFAGVAFPMVPLAENARVPVDNRLRTWS